MHDQQIAEFDRLKKITFAMATGKRVEAEQPEVAAPQYLTAADRRKQVDLELHSECNRDLLLLAQEQRRQESVLTKLSNLFRDLIKVNIMREEAPNSQEQPQLQSSIL